MKANEYSFEFISRGKVFQRAGIARAVGI